MFYSLVLNIDKVTSNHIDSVSKNELSYYRRLVVRSRGVFTFNESYDLSCLQCLL